MRKYSRRLGHELAKLHQHNITLGVKARKLENSVTKPPAAKETEEGSAENGTGPPKYITQFGFHTNTCCGYIPQENAWSDDWLVSTFYSSPASENSPGKFEEILLFVYLLFTFLLQTFFTQQRLQYQFDLLEKEVEFRVNTLFLQWACSVEVSEVISNDR